MLTILILLIHEQKICFHSVVASLISFINVFYFSEYRSFTSLFKFISRYFVLSDAIVSGIFFVTALSDSLLLVYRDTNFLFIDLYPAA